MKKLSKSIFSILMAMSLFSSVVFAETAELMQISDTNANNITESAGFSQYNCFPALTFEDELPSYWEDEELGGVIEFVKDDPEFPAHSGSGAMYVDTTSGAAAIWGGQAGMNRPQIGDTISGYFYFKKLSNGVTIHENWRLPEVRLYDSSMGNYEDSYFCVTEDVHSSSIEDAPLNEWIRGESS